MDSHFVEIVDSETEEVIKRMGPHPERHTKAIRRGAEENIDHSRFYVRVVEEGDE